MSLEVADVSTMEDYGVDLSDKLHGRRVIYSSEDEITDDNVIDVLNKAIPIHELNRKEIVFLERYVRGWQPILNRTKNYNAEINNKVVVNIANQIVTFKASEFAGEPIQYVSRGSMDEKVPDKVAQVNDMMMSEGKQTKDMELAQKMFTDGVGYRLVFHDTGRDKSDYLDEAPFEMYVTDSKNSFVVRKSDVTKKVLMGVTYVFKNYVNATESVATTPVMGVPEYTVYTPNVTYVIGQGQSGLEIKKRDQHNFGMVSLIEYPCNPSYMSCIEPVIPLLNAINLTESNRLDGIEQFIQALMVFDGVDISREDFLELKDLGAIKLPATQNAGGGKKLYYLNEQLDQSQTQTLVNDLYKTVLQIVGMPSQGDGSTGDSSNNGAIVLKNGWQGAETRAEDFEAMFKLPETEMLPVVAILCNGLGDFSFDPADLDIKFTRHSYDNLLSKSQTLTTMLGNDKIHPKSAFEASGLFADTEDAYQMGMEWYEKQQKKAEEQFKQQAKVMPNAEK